MEIVYGSSEILPGTGVTDDGGMGVADTPETETVEEVTATVTVFPVPEVCVAVTARPVFGRVFVVVAVGVGEGVAVVVVAATVVVSGTVVSVIADAVTVGVAFPLPAAPVSAGWMHPPARTNAITSRMIAAMMIAAIFRYGTGRCEGRAVLFPGAAVYPPPYALAPPLPYRMPTPGAGVFFHSARPGHAWLGGNRCSSQKFPPQYWQWKGSETFFPQVSHRGISLIESRLAQHKIFVFPEKFRYYELSEVCTHGVCRLDI
jgi:hypothetical protein